MVCRQGITPVDADYTFSGGWAKIAKKESNRIRRENAKREIRGAIIDTAGDETPGSQTGENGG